MLHLFVMENFFRASVREGKERRPRVQVSTQTPTSEFWLQLGLVSFTVLPKQGHFLWPAVAARDGEMTQRTQLVAVPSPPVSSHSPESLETLESATQEAGEGGE